MPVAFVNSAAGQTANGTSVSFTYTSGSGSDRALLVGGYSTDTINSATFDGVSMTAVSGGASGPVHTFALANPAIGAKTLAFALSAYNSVRYAAADFTGVDQATPVGTGVNGTGTAATVTTASVTVPSGGMAWGYGHHNYTPALTINSGSLASVATGFGGSWAGAYRSTTGALAWNSSGGGSWIAIGVPINAVPATGPTINTQPSNTTVNEPAGATLTVSATGTGTLHYQWKRAEPGSGTFANVGTDSASLNIASTSTAADNGAQYKVDVSDDNGTTVSSTVTLTVRSTSTTARPNADLTVTGWTASGGGSLFDMIDEASASDADYITSPALSPSTAPATFGLQYPLAAGTWTIGIRARTTAGAGTLTVELLDSGGTVVGTSAGQALTTTFATYSLSITTTGVAARARITITNP